MAATRSNGESLSTSRLVARLSIPVVLEFPESLQPWLERVIVSMTLLALLAVFLRLYSRRLNQVPLWYDDWLAVGNLCWFVLVAGLIAGDVGLGLGLHDELVAESHATPMVQIGLAINIMYLWCLVWSKLSLIALYYRVFGFGYFKYACWAVAVLVVAWAIASTLSLLFLCIPLARFWDSRVEGYCHDGAPIRLANSISTIVTDVVILCLPVPQIWGLHGLRATDRIGLFILFALGFFVVSIAAARIVIQQYDQMDDKTYSIAPDSGWIVIEMAAAIVSASFVTMGPAVIETWRYIQHVSNACRGRAAHVNAAHARHGVELRTRSEEVGHEGVGSHQQHPDEVDGSFHRLYSKGQNGSAVTQGPTESLHVPSHGTPDSDDGASSEPTVVQSDRASEEVSLRDILQQTSVAHSNKQ